MDITKTVDYLARQVRAYHPSPGSFLMLKGGPLKVHQAHVIKQANTKTGLMDTMGGQPAFAAADGWLVLDIVQPAGKKSMKGTDFLRGARDWNGQIKSSKLKEKT